MKILRLVGLLLFDSESTMIKTIRKFRFILNPGFTLVFSFAVLGGSYQKAARLGSTRAQDYLKDTGLTW